MEAQILLPDVEDPDAAEFWAGCARGELLVQTCSDCGLRRMPPRPMCPRCRSLKFGWDEMSFIVPHPPLLPAYQELAPYNVIVVALEEDPTLRMVGNLVDRPDGAINEVDPATIEIGEPVRVVFQRVEDVVLPRWMKT